MSKKKQFLVSLLKSMYDTMPETISLDKVYQLIILETFRSDTEKHRYYKSAGQKKEAQSVKDKMMNFTPSVILAGGKAGEHVTGYTGLGMADFDHVPPDDIERCFRLLDADPYVVLAYTTISGEGVRVVYFTDVTESRFHSDVFLQGNTYYARLFGYKYDAQCSNIARTSILCYCPRAVYHPQAEAMHIELAPQAKAQDALPAKKKGRPARRCAATVEEAEQSILEQLDADGKTYVEGHYNEYVSAAVYLMNRYGVGEDDVRAWAAGRFADYDVSKLESIVHSVYLHTDEHGTQQLPSVKGRRFSFAPLPEVEKFITSQARVRNNVITERREICLEGEPDFRDITDRDENTLWARANKMGVYSGAKTIQMILNSEYVDDYHPFVSYLDGLDAWDGKTDYIRLLANTVHTADQELFYTYFRKWFVGFIASLVNPSVINQVVLVLIGKQGYYKTTWMNRLLPREWERYFFTKTNSDRMTKDDKISLSEFALICFEEIDNMRPSEMNQFKAMVTMPSINERSAYARNKMHRAHVASFCGTGNNIAFLNDPTGTRRWLAFEALSIDDPFKTSLPYREIYAQGLALYRSGFRYWFNQEEMDRLGKHNEQFEVPCMERELVQMYYRKPMPGEHGVFVSTAEIMQRINVMIKTPLSLSTLGTSMRKLGFAPCRSNSARGYRVVELTSDEMMARKQMIDLPGEQSLEFRTSD